MTAIDDNGKEVITQSNTLQVGTSNHDVMKEIEKLQEATAEKAFRYESGFYNSDINEKRAVSITIMYFKEKDDKSNVYKTRQYDISNEDLERIYQAFITRISKDKPKDTNITTTMNSGY